jgi:hypothetical protein
VSHLYSNVHKRVHRVQRARSAMVIREPQLAYVTGYEPCCDQHAYAVVVPMSTHIVAGLVSGHAIGGAPNDAGVVPRWAFTMPLAEFLELEMIDVVQG